MAVMTAEGADIKARRERLGADRSDLARESAVNVDTIRDIETGETLNPRGSTLAKITQALDRMEEESGMSSPAVPSQAPGLMEFEVSGDFGVRVVVKGPVTDAAALEQAVARLVRDIRAGQDEGQTPAE